MDAQKTKNIDHQNRATFNGRQNVSLFQMIGTIQEKTFLPLSYHTTLFQRPFDVRNVQNNVETTTSRFNYVNFSTHTSDVHNVKTTFKRRQNNVVHLTCRMSK